MTVCVVTAPLRFMSASNRSYSFGVSATGSPAPITFSYAGSFPGWAPLRLRRFLQAVGVKTEFADYGVDEADSRRMVASALDGVRGKNFIGAAP